MKDNRRSILAVCMAFLEADLISVCESGWQGDTVCHIYKIISRAFAWFERGTEFTISMFE